MCDHCKRCAGCGRALCDPRRFSRCSFCRPLTEAQRKQLTRLHASIRGDRNPSKRPEVVRKIAAAVKDNHPSKLYPEKWTEQAAKMRASGLPKRSRLEDMVALLLPELERWHRIGPYIVDFADPKARLAVEVQGCWWHACQECYPEAPTYPRQRQSVKNDRIRKTWLEGTLPLGTRDE